MRWVVVWVVGGASVAGLVGYVNAERFEAANSDGVVCIS